jgi:hypothetical protein
MLASARQASLKPGVEIRGRPVVRDHHFLGKDDHVLADGSPSDDQIFALIVVKFWAGLPCYSKMVVLQATMEYWLSITPAETDLFPQLEGKNLP